jgi:hypothetical protein
LERNETVETVNEYAVTTRDDNTTENCCAITNTATPWEGGGGEGRGRKK